MQTKRTFIITSILTLSGVTHAQMMNNTTISRDLSNVPPSVMNRFQGTVQQGDVPSNITRTSPANTNSIPPLVHTQRTQNPQSNPQNAPSSGSNRIPLPDVKSLDCTPPTLTEEQMKTVATQYNNELASFASQNNLIGVTLDEKENLSQGVITTQFIYMKLPKSLKCHTLRILAPNSIVTMDYSVNRINVYIDENKRITKFMIG